MSFVYLKGKDKPHKTALGHRFVRTCSSLSYQSPRPRVLDDRPDLFLGKDYCTIPTNPTFRHHSLIDWMSLIDWGVTASPTWSAWNSTPLAISALYRFLYLISNAYLVIMGLAVMGNLQLFLTDHGYINPSGLISLVKDGTKFQGACVKG